MQKAPPRSAEGPTELLLTTITKNPIQIPF